MIPRLDIIYLRKRVAARFFAILDSQGVVFFQSIVYVGQTISGFYNRFVAHRPPDDLAKALGQWSSLWLYLCIAVSICLIGKIMSTSQRLWVKTAGLYLQFVGDICALGMFLGYVLSAIQQSKWGDPMSSPFTYGCLALCAFFLSWRDLRRITQQERRNRR